MNPPQILPESQTEISSDIYHPSTDLLAETDYLLARKEITLGKITDFDLALLSLWDNIADACAEMGIKTAKSMHEHQLYFWVNAKRSVGGFERQEQGKIKNEVSGSVDYKGNAPKQYIMPQ